VDAGECVLHPEPLLQWSCEDVPVQVVRLKYIWLTKTRDWQYSEAVNLTFQQLLSLPRMELGWCG
jgi:hypothetical protein